MAVRIASSLCYWCSTSNCRIASINLLNSKRLAHTLDGAYRNESNPFPYPRHRHPTPHQIFHLPYSATEAEIKSRYYDLVRLYHPDKVIPSSASSVAADEAHARFQAITAAYDTLRGKAPLGDIASSATSGTAYPTTAAYRTMQRKRQELYEKGAVDDSRLDKWLIVGVVGTVLFVVIHNLTTRRELIVEAVSRSRALASESRSRQIREAEARLSMDAVELVNNKAP